MIELTVTSSEYYKLLGELNKLTPKIPKQIKTVFVPDGAIGVAYVTFRVDGLSGEDEVYFKLKYNGTYTAHYD